MRESVFLNKPPTIDTLEDWILRLCANAVLVTALMPYVSPIVISNMDVQMMGFVTSICVLLLILIVMPWRISVTNVDVTILGIGLFSLLYVKPSFISADPEWLRACAPIVLGFPVYFAVRNLYRYMSPRVFIVVVMFYFLILVFELLFSGLYTSIFKNFLSDIRWFVDEGRGPNGLCPEPSYMGNMCVLFVASLYFFYRQYWQLHRNLALTIFLVSGLMLLITKSATGVVLALVLSVVALFESRLTLKRKLLISVLVIGSVGASSVILSDSESRGGAFIAAAARNPVVAIQDPSLAARVFGVFEGLIQLSDAPLGTAEVSIPYELTSKTLNGSIASWLWPNPELRSYLVDLVEVLDRNTGIGAMIQRMGLFGIAIPLLLLSYVDGFEGKWVVRIFVVGLMFNASLFISTLWFIIGTSVAIQQETRSRRRMKTHFFNVNWLRIRHVGAQLN